MNKDEIEELVERWAEHGPKTGKALLEIAVSARMPDDKVLAWCRALQFCSAMADAQHRALTTLSAKVETLEAAARNITPYLNWTISAESPGFHPTMPSAVGAFKEALAGDTDNG